MTRTGRGSASTSTMPTNICGRAIGLAEVGGHPFLLTLPMVSKDFNVTCLEKPISSEVNSAVVEKFKVNVIDCDLDVDKNSGE